jgi:hypothetical protein
MFPTVTVAQFLRLRDGTFDFARELVAALRRA